MEFLKQKVLQHEGELDRLIAIMRAENVRSYLEIGSKFGGSLWKIANALPPRSRVVSVDLPHGNRASEVHLRECVQQLNLRGYDARLFIGDSTYPTVADLVRTLGPFDACFIDANHTESYVRRDWQNYGPMARIVAFHDIAFDHVLPAGKMPIEVRNVWNEIKQDYRHEEIRLCDTPDNGIGVLWR